MTSQFSTPLISICIANFNGEHLLADCIDSILAQSGNFDVEIIVHDDSSSDGSLRMLAQRYPQVIVIQSDENVGFCIANNRMASRSRGQYLLLLNNDAALFPDALSTLVQAASSEPSAILTLPQYDWVTGSLVDRGCFLDPFCNPIPNLDASITDVAYVIGACLWCPRPLWDDLGGLPEWMGSIGEDLYLCGLARLRRIGVRALPNSGYLHRQGATFGGNRADAGLHTSIRRRQLSERNKTRALIVLTPSLMMLPLLSIHIVLLALEGLTLSIWRRDLILWREIYRPALTLPFSECTVLQVRRNEVQATRTVSVKNWFSPVHFQLRKITMLLRYGVPTVR